MMGIRIKQYELRIKVLLNCFLLALFLILAALFYHPTFAQTTSNCGTGATQRAQGLVTAPALSTGSNFSTSGGCIIDPKAAFVPYKIPTYDDLKSLYFDQSKSSKTDATPGSGTASQGTIRSALNSYDVVLIRGNLELNGNLGGTSKTAVIFIDGNLNFGNNFIFGDDNTGVVFVVGGNVNISQSVTQVDAVIIAKGIICTAYGGTACPTTNIETSQLVINGSLISINQEDSTPIKFRRTLSNNRLLPAEKINHQVKYLIILRDLISDTLQKWSEIP